MAPRFRTQHRMFMNKKHLPQIKFKDASLYELTASNDNNLMEQQANTLAWLVIELHNRTAGAAVGTIEATPLNVCFIAGSIYSDEHPKHDDWRVKRTCELLDDTDNTPDFPYGFLSNTENAKDYCDRLFVTVAQSLAEFWLYRSKVAWDVAAKDDDNHPRLSNNCLFFLELTPRYSWKLIEDYRRFATHGITYPFSEAFLATIRELAPAGTVNAPTFNWPIEVAA